MGKSSRSSRLKTNNRVLKKKVFGPVETARTERLNAKLLALAKAPQEQEMKEATEADNSEFTSPTRGPTLPPHLERKSQQKIIENSPPLTAHSFSLSPLQPKIRPTPNPKIPPRWTSTPHPPPAPKNPAANAK
jgi:hypothetical protein